MNEKTQEYCVRALMRTMIWWGRLWDESGACFSRAFGGLLTRLVMSRPGGFVLHRLRIHVGHF